MGGDPAAPAMNALDWIRGAEDTFSALLAGYLKNVESAVNENLEWLRTSQAELGEKAKVPPTITPTRRRRGQTQRMSSINCITPTENCNIPEVLNETTPYNSIGGASVTVGLGLPVAMKKPVKKRPKATLDRSSPSQTLYDSIKCSPVMADETLMMTAPQIEPQVTLTAITSVKQVKDDELEKRLEKKPTHLIPIISSPKNHTNMHSVDETVIQPVTPREQYFNSPVGFVQSKFVNPKSPLNSPIPKRPIAPRSPLIKKQEPSNSSPLEPKFEAWTSRFVKKPSLDAPKKGIPVIEVPKTNKVIREDNNTPIVTTFPIQPATTLHRLDTSIRSDTGDIPLPTIEFFPPPPTVTRRRKNAAPLEHTESPLTRAKRIDAQNSWREAQLKNLLTSKVDSLKSALDSLRPEPELELKPELGFELRPELGFGAELGLGPELGLETGPELGTELEFAPKLELGFEPQLKFRSEPELELDQKVSSLKGKSDSSGENVKTDVVPGGLIQEKVPSLKASPIKHTGKVTTVTVLPLADPTITMETLEAITATISTNIKEFSSFPKISTETFELLEKEQVGPSKKASLIINSESINDSQLEPPNLNVHYPKVKNDFEENGFGASGLGKANVIMPDQVELERKRRLRERNVKALERKRQLLQKAQQQSRTNKMVAELSGKSREPDNRSKPSHIPVKVTREVPSLQRQVMVNNAIKVIKNHSETTTTKKDDGRTSGGVFCMPLPKKSPTSKVSNSNGGGHPSSDDIFTIPTKLAMSPTSSSPTPPATSMATITPPTFPILPKISSECSSDEEPSIERSKSTKQSNKPPWANTPEILKSLQQQRIIKPEDIFGEVEPVKLEDSGRKFTRGRTSSIWRHP